MDAPPVNRLLQLLRQKPSDLQAQSQPAQVVSLHRKRRRTPSLENGIQPATESSTQPATNGIQPATESSTQPATNGIQPATESSTQPATNGIQPATESSTRYATGSDISLTATGLSKGQRRVLQFLLANRNLYNPSRTIIIGYYTISKYCFLSRNGSRKIIEQLGRRGLIKRVETQRGEVQGSVYSLESSIQYATQNSIPDPGTDSEKSSVQYATNIPFCSSSKKLLLQDVLLEDAFRDLNPRSLEPYLNHFETTEDLQNFLDIANACITAAKAGRGKPIQNPHGFLLAQLRTGYINPPEGYKSRKVRAQEIRNQQLEEELAALRQLKERERELQFGLFEASLTEEEQQRLEQEARVRVNPNIGLSTKRQIEIQKDAILKEWFEQREKESPHETEKRVSTALSS
jgi:hypothetical protein